MAHLKVKRFILSTKSRLRNIRFRAVACTAIYFLRIRDRKLIELDRKYQTAHLQVHNFYFRPTSNLYANPFPRNGVYIKYAGRGGGVIRRTNSPADTPNLLASSRLVGA